MTGTRPKCGARLLGMLLLTAAPASAQSEGWTARAYLGASKTIDGTVHIVGPGTELTFDAVTWAGESFRGPVYYGLRIGRWWSTGWGVAVDFTHAKMIAERSRIVRVTGTRGGIPVDAQERLDETFDALSFSHGYNLVTLNVAHGWRHRPDGTTRRLQPYVGAGAGLVLAHVEVTADGAVTDGYQLTGPATQGLAGVDVPLSRSFAIFLEYRLSLARVHGDLSGGGSVRVRPLTHHFLIGGSFALHR